MTRLIANARMYAVSPECGVLWRRLFASISERSGIPLDPIEHAAPAPIAELWQRQDLGAVFMCGLPWSLSRRRPALIAAPVPRPTAFGGQPRYWTELVVHDDSPFRCLEDTFGHRVAFTTPESQSGFFAPLYELQAAAARRPLFSQVIEPRGTPLGALTAVIERVAEVAAVDAFSFQLLQKFRPELTSRVRIVASTRPTPIPPLVSTASADAVEALRAAFTTRAADSGLRAMLDALLVAEFARVDADDYEHLRAARDLAVACWRRHPLAASVHPAFELQAAS